MVGTLRKALQYVIRSDFKEWVQSLEDMLYGYGRGPGTDGIAPFGILSGVKLSFSIDLSLCTLGAEVLSHAGPFELAVVLIYRAESLVPRTVFGSTRYQIGDMVFLRHGRLPQGSKFQARMWLGSYEVIYAYRPYYLLGNASRRNSRKLVHFRRF